jgi:maleylacetate reductase
LVRRRHDPAQHVKEPYGYPMMVPPSIILDPAITLSTPPAGLRSAGMKAIDHAAERLASLVIEPFNRGDLDTGTPPVVDGIGARA